MNKTRFIILTIDSITELFKDYMGQEDLPDDVQPLKLMVNPTNKKLAIIMGSDTWKQDMPPLNVNFKIKRVYGV